MTGRKPKVLLVGGPDADARIEVLRGLSADFDIGAVGSATRPIDAFQAASIPYFTYTMSRKVNPLADIIAIQQLKELFRRLRPTIVHTYDTKPCVLARLAAHKAEVPIIIGTITGSGSLYSDSKLSTRLLRACCETMMRLASRHSAMTIFYNREDAQMFLDKALVTLDRYHIIPGSGINTRQFSPEAVPAQTRAEVRHAAHINQQDLVVTMVSRLIRSKGVIEFMQAAAKIHAEYPHVKFLLVGPRDTESIESITDTELTNHQQDVMYLGERRDIAAILCASTIFVLPTFLPEGIPRVLLEAAAIGLPLITTDMPGCRDIVYDGLNGLLVPIKDVTRLTVAIRTLIDNPVLRAKFGAVSRQFAINKFDTTLITDNIASIYHTLLEKQVGEIKNGRHVVQSHELSTK